MTATATSLDLSKLNATQLAALQLIVPGPEVADELKRRTAFLDIGEAMDAVAVVRARVDAFKLGRVTAVAQTLLHEVGLDDLLNRLLATAHVMGIAVATPTLAQIKPPAAPLAE